MAVPMVAAETFVERYDSWLRAVAALAVTVVVLFVVHRWLDRQAGEITKAVAGGELRPEATTRLRFLRRLIDLAIVLVGITVAVSNFPGLGNLAGAVLTSSAIVAAVVGFAARQTLANAIAGLLLAIAQPVRIGDHVRFESESGVVEDVRLSATWLRTPGGARIIVPNERLAAGILRNDSIGGPTVDVEASVWLAPGADVVGALEALRAALGEVTVSVAETSAEGVRIGLSGTPVAPALRAASESTLREDAFRALRAAAPAAPS